MIKNLVLGISFILLLGCRNCGTTIYVGTGPAPIAINDGWPKEK